MPASPPAEPRRDRVLTRLHKARPQDHGILYALVDLLRSSNDDAGAHAFSTTPPRPIPMILKSCGAILQSC